MRAVPTIPLAGVTHMCHPSGDEEDARSRAGVLASGGWRIEVHDPPAARDDDPTLRVVATVVDPISRTPVDYVTYREAA